VRHQLGRQLDALSHQDLTARIDELTAHNHRLADQLAQATATNSDPQARATALEDDLAAARTSLRRMIHHETGTRSRYSSMVDPSRKMKPR
jgi:hypothetical protein